MGFIKQLCSFKDTIRETNTQPQKGRKYSQHFYLTKDLYTKWLNNSSKSIIKKTNAPIKMGKDVNRHFTRG